MTTPVSEASHWNRFAHIKYPGPEIWGHPEYESSTDVCVRHLVDGIEDIWDVDAIEIGAGIGRLANKMGLLLRSVAGFDVSGELLDIARREAPSNVLYKKNDGRTLLGWDVDLVYSMVTFQHLDGKTVRGYIDEAYRVLREGGILRFQFVEGNKHEDFDHKYLSYAEIEPWCRDAGFSSVTIKSGIMYPEWSWCTAIK
jgi:SAM-dependent methyltransferase